MLSFQIYVLPVFYSHSHVNEIISSAFAFIMDQRKRELPKLGGKHKF